MNSIIECISRRYSHIAEGDECGFLFMSCSPESKKGLLPNIISLNNYNIDTVGDNNQQQRSLHLKHITDLDLTDNLMSRWEEVASILAEFPSLYFLNLTNNMLSKTIISDHFPPHKRSTNLRKLVLNGNRLNWESIHLLLEVLPELEELHLSINNLHDIPDVDFRHEYLRLVSLSCNPISDLAKLQDRLVFLCPRLEGLSLAECPVSQVPRLDKQQVNTLKALNLSCSEIDNWQQIDNLNSYKGLSELKIQECPLLRNYTAHERRMMLVARLPNIKILNGGDHISPEEREDSERAFIRYHLYAADEEGHHNNDDKPDRLEELISLHGLLEPLVNIDMTPETSVSVKIMYKDEERHEQVCVRQTVKSFKKQIEGMYSISACSMRVFYYDQEMHKLTGPEEMKYGSKGLYTYNIRDGDYFVVDVKPRQKKSSGSLSSPHKNKKN